MANKIALTLIDTTVALATLVDKLITLPKGSATSEPHLYVNLEGTNLCRYGKVSILTMLVSALNHVYLIDVHTLGPLVFNTPGTCGKTFKDVLESADITNAFWDVRNDSDALFAHYGVSVAGVQDIQLMELATRSYSRKYVLSLNKAIQQDISASHATKQQWRSINQEGVKLFASRLGGSHYVFNERPLRKAIYKYCVQDVALLPRLWHEYQRMLTSSWATKVKAATAERVRESQGAIYQPHGRSKALGPW